MAHHMALDIVAAAVKQADIDRTKQAREEEARNERAKNNTWVVQVVRMLYHNYIDSDDDEYDPEQEEQPFIEDNLATGFILVERDGAGNVSAGTCWHYERAMEEMQYMVPEHQEDRMASLLTDAIMTGHGAEIAHTHQYICATTFTRQWYTTRADLLTKYRSTDTMNEAEVKVTVTDFAPESCAMIRQGHSDAKAMVKDMVMAAFCAARNFIVT